MIQPGTVIQGRYRVEHLLGQGGQGSVYLVTHVSLGTKRAMKVVMRSGNPSDLAWQQLEREARILAGLSHPNLAQVTDLVEEPAFLGVVMEYVDGESLDTRRGTCAPEGWVLSVAAQVLDALEYLHGQTPPVIHRDLNPRNIIVASDGRVRVVDFGIAKIPSTGILTETVVRGYGTAGFAPPEQYGRGGTDAASDLYSLAATMLSLLGKSDPPDAMDRVQGAPLRDPRQHNPTVSAGTWSALQQTLSIRQSTRPQSAADARWLLFPNRQSGSVAPAVAATPLHGSAVGASPHGAHPYAPTVLAPSPPAQPKATPPNARPTAAPADDSPVVDFFIGAGGWRNTMMAMMVIFYVNGDAEKSPHALVSNVVFFVGLILNATLSSIFRSSRARSQSPSSGVCIAVYVFLWIAIIVTLGIGLTWAEGIRRRSGLR